MGCIPTKALVASAEALHTARRGAEFGFRVEGLVADWPRARARKGEIVGRIRGGLERSLTSGQGPELVRGWARFLSPTRLSEERVHGAPGEQVHAVE